MNRTLLLWVPLLLAAATVAAEDAKPGEPAAEATPAKVAPAADKAEGGAKSIAGMSILGNQEAPKSLVIVPWKSSEIGDSLGFSALLDDSRKPVDRDVFMRELGYYQIRAETP
jgi:hypothetical protein